MKVLVACEESQIVCKAFRERGHEAYSCDLQDCSGGHPEWHLRGDVLREIYDVDFIYQFPNYKHWDMIIAFPPCTDLAVSNSFTIGIAEKALQKYSAEPGNVEGDGQDELWERAARIIYIKHNADQKLNSPVGLRILDGIMNDMKELKSQFHISKICPSSKDKCPIGCVGPIDGLCSANRLERTFSLQEALDIWDAGMTFQYTETRRVLGLPTKEIINKDQYFKEKFSINLKKQTDNDA